jgi:hypothetical protein
MQVNGWEIEDDVLMILMAEYDLGTGNGTASIPRAALKTHPDLIRQAELNRQPGQSLMDAVRDSLAAGWTRPAGPRR